MDLKKLHGDKIKNIVFDTFHGAWSILIHDPFTSSIINNLFRKSDLLDFFITGSFSIKDKRPNWELPIIYFVNCTKEVAKIINSEFTFNKHMPIHVYSLCDPVGLDSLIPCTVTNLDMVAVEERIFICQWDNLVSLANVLEGKFNINFKDCTKKLAEKISEKLDEKMDEKSRISNVKNISLLVLDRTFDIFTPFMYFFTFRSIIEEIGEIECNDNYYPKLRNKHIGDIDGVLKHSIEKLKESSERLSSKKIDINDLDVLVNDAPKNIELTKNISKYHEYLKKVIKKYDLIKDIAEAQQDLVTGRDKTGKMATFALDSFLKLIVAPSLNYDDRLCLLFLLKAKSIHFSKSERDLLISKGFSKSDLDILFNQRNQMLRRTPIKTEYEISRYEPILGDVVEDFIVNPEKFSSFSTEEKILDSLRKSSMLNASSATKKTIVVYVNNGIRTEELKLAYLISEKLGIECIFGSNKILSRSGFVKEFKTNKELQEVQNSNRHN